ncbi:hypothetical protein P261_02195 [Lachnospiraceae bacterium TWA4]|nr:hypothetical protein P261_02195 [Lachnospiraceae bacterium TWA4]
MKQLLIDGNELTDSKALHKFLKQELNFPEYYGENLDALYDILSVYDEEFIEFEFINKKPYMQAFINVLEDVENLTITIRGEVNDY